MTNELARVADRVRSNLREELPRRAILVIFVAIALAILVRISENAGWMRTLVSWFPHP